MTLHRLSAADIELIESPDPTLNRQYFRVYAGRRVGRCYVESPPAISPQTWTALVAEWLNTLVAASGRDVLDELCNPAGLALNVAPAQQRDATVRVALIATDESTPKLADQIAEKARAQVQLVGNEIAEFVFPGKSTKQARADLEFGLRVVLGERWSDLVSILA